MKKKRRKRKSRQQPVVLGIAWYKPEEWEAWKATCPEFDKTYADWEREANKSLQQMQDTGITVEKVVLDRESFLLWCDEHDQNRDSAARTQYVTELLQKGT